MDTITYKILALQFNRPLALELPLKEYGTAFLQLSPFEKLEAIFKDNDFLIRFPQTGNLDESTPLTPTYYRAFGFAYSSFMGCIQPFLA